MSTVCFNVGLQLRDLYKIVLFPMFSGYFEVFLQRFFNWICVPQIYGMPLNAT